MMVKKCLKIVMPILKRCRVADSAGDDNESSVNRKKRKSWNGYYPLHFLGEAVAGIIPYGYGIGKILSKVGATDIGGGQFEISESVASEGRIISARISRGRIQVLPSRFNDSILDNRKKDKSFSRNEVRDSALDIEYEPIRQKDNKFSFKTPRIHGDASTNRKRNENKTNKFKCSKFSPLSEDEIAELRNDGLRDRNSRKFKHSRDLTTLHEHSEDEEEYDDCIEIPSVERLFSTKEFVEGDIVRAIWEKHRPAWPSIVIKSHKFRIF